MPFAPEKFRLRIASILSSGCDVGAQSSLLPKLGHAKCHILDHRRDSSGSRFMRLTNGNPTINRVWKSGPTILAVD